MSFDVFFRGFLASKSSERGGAQTREVPAPHISGEDQAFPPVRAGDGEADIYLSDDAMMAGHISGRDPGDLLVQGARAANWVIMPAGCPTCLTRPGQREELPGGLDDDVAAAGTGAGLLAVVKSH